MPSVGLPGPKMPSLGMRLGTLSVASSVGLPGLKTPSLGMRSEAKSVASSVGTGTSGWKMPCVMPGLGMDSGTSGTLDLGLWWSPRTSGEP